jgi:exodeoxyribonuclease V beta subunit
MPTSKNKKSIPLSGLRLIEASAGTGKTHTITALFLRLILEKELTLDQILVVTYTEAATEELRDRIRNKLRDKKTELGREEGSPENKKKISLLQQALINFDEAAIFTIHGFCFRVLKEQAYESSSLFDTELITNQDHLLQETVDDFWRKSFYNASPAFAAYALQANYSSEGFRKLVSRHLQNPLLKIIPEAQEVESEVLEKSFNRAYNEAADCWNQTRDEIEEILISTDSLKLNIYKKESIPKWLTEFDTFFSGKSSSVLFPDKLTKLKSSELEKGKKKNHDPPEHPFFELCEALIEKKDALVDAFKEKLLVLEKNLFIYSREALEQKKAHHNVLYFDDLLLNVYSALYSRKGNSFAESIRKKYKAALIDEFQDTDPVQYKIFSKLFIHRDTSLFLIGDPKQAIYSFRNADLFAYLKAAEKAGKPFTLDTNWRSDPGLIRAVNSLFYSHKNPFLYHKIGFKNVKPSSGSKDKLKINNLIEPPFQLWFVPTDKEQESKSLITKPQLREYISNAVAGEVSRLLALSGSGRACINDKPITPGDIAVLVRTHKQAALIQEGLKKYSIPSILHSTGNIFGTKDAAQLIYLLEALANPGDERKVKAALSTYILGVKGEQLVSTDSNVSFLETEMADFQKYHDLWNSSGFFPMFQQLLIEKTIRPRLITLADGERKLTNILHLAELIHNCLTQENLGMSATVKWFSEQVQEDVHHQDEELLRLETDKDAIKIVTIHKSKGLEYPIVFCPFLWDGQSKNNKAPAVFHDRQGNITLDLGSDSIEENRTLSTQETLSESMRLLYVALTRAKNRCYLVWGGFKEAGTSPLAYLFHNQNCTDPAQAVQTTENLFKSLGDDDIFKALNSYEDLSEKTIRVSPIPEANDNLKVYSGTEKKPVLCNRTFDKQISREIRFTSFSSIISGRHHESDLPEADEFFHDTRDESKNDGLSIFNFPAGAVPGTMLHEVLEHLDFTLKTSDDIDNLIRDKFFHYEFEEKWVPTIRNMITDLLDVSLVPEDKGLCLSQIKNNARLNELGFYFPLKNLSKQTLGSLFSKTEQPPALVGFADEIEKLNFSPLNGFIKGFIDLIFMYKGKFYIVDWKSNLIGKDINHYKEEHLIPIMQNDYYILQYHLYTLALHKYLKNRLPDYDYEKDFGGVFYIFLRGINKTKGHDYGIFRDRPKKELILEMERELEEQ